MTRLARPSRLPVDRFTFAVITFSTVHRIRIRIWIRPDTKSLDTVGILIRSHPRIRPDPGFLLKCFHQWRWTREDYWLSIFNCFLMDDVFNTWEESQSRVKRFVTAILRCINSNEHRYFVHPPRGRKPHTFRRPPAWTVSGPPLAKMFTCTSISTSCSADRGVYWALSVRLRPGLRTGRRSESSLTRIRGGRFVAGEGGEFKERSILCC